jgi:hypothetical protein
MKRSRENLCAGKSVTPYLHCPEVFMVTDSWKRRRDSAAGIATGYWLEDRGLRVRVPVGSRIFFTSSRLASGPIQPPIQWEPGALSSGVKRPGRKADHSPPTSARSRQYGSIHPLPLYVFMA